MAETTSTCYCGTIQMSYSLEGENLVDTVCPTCHLHPLSPESIYQYSNHSPKFVCHCTDDRKITGSMFATNFLIKTDTVKYVRGEDKITNFAQTGTIATGNTMTSHFCSVCGSLMSRTSSGFPGMAALRLGMVDDFEKHETVLKPRIEQFAGKRVAWLKPAEGVEQQEWNYYGGVKSG